MQRRRWTAVLVLVAALGSPVAVAVCEMMCAPGGASSAMMPACHEHARAPEGPGPALSAAPTDTCRHDEAAVADAVVPRSETLDPGALAPVARAADAPPAFPEPGPSHALSPSSSPPFRRPAVLRI